MKQPVAQPRVAWLGLIFLSLAWGTSFLFTQLALESVMGGFGKVFVAIALFFFAFTTLLAYYYIAETNVAYIRRTIRFPGELTILKLILLGSVFYGTIREANLAWAMGDLGVGDMIVPGLQTL